MITMEMLGKVKRLYSRGKKSLHEIAKTTGLSRNTIRKWVRQTKELVKPTYRRKETANKLTAFSEALVLALKADTHRTKQNRRTAKALFVQIKAHGYTGGYSRVTDFIRDWRQTEGKAPKAFVPLAFESGEAFQFDWSDEGMVVGGIYYKLQVAHLKLCLSRAFWLVAYSAQGDPTIHLACVFGLGGEAAQGANASPQAPYGKRIRSRTRLNRQQMLGVGTTYGAQGDAGVEAHQASLVLDCQSEKIEVGQLPWPVHVGVVEARGV